jgi:choline-glycine betaine transporter
MSIQPPLTELDIETADSGFYEGFSKVVAIGSKLAIGALILWAILFPAGAGAALKGIRSTIDANTGSWYMYVMTLYIVVCLALAIWPSTGKNSFGRRRQQA